MSRRPTSDPALGTSARGVILLLVALVLGVFILAKTDADESAPAVETESPDTTEADERAVTTSSTRAPRQPAEIKVLAANGSGVPGLGAKTGDRLTAAGYNSLAPTNTTANISTSVVLFTPGFDLEAFYVALVLGLPPTAVQTIEGNTAVVDTKGADIVVLVGPDLDVTTPTTGAGAVGGVTTTTVFGATTTTIG